MPQQDDNAATQGRLTYDDLEQLAIDAFRAFEAHPENWPNRVIFDRSGTSDVNVHGTWLYDRDSEFFNIPFRSLAPLDSGSIGTSPDDSAGGV